ncbi:MAG: hypothetical protein SFX74_09610, partial [Fimbriimonadaceae bacterium]|nr:hypothetical protein [Fimbriimonadaceae bacterium]
MRRGAGILPADRAGFGRAARPDGPHPQPLLPQKGEGAPERDAGTWTGPFGFAGNWGYQEDGDSGL